MEDTLISFETAKLAKEKGFNWEGQVVFDLKENNFIVNFKDIAIKTFIDDCETGYRDKALNYFKEDIIRTDDNTDEGYYILAPTQSLLQKWLREVHNIEVLVSRIPPEAVLASKTSGKSILKNYNCYVWNYNSNPRVLNNGTFQDVYEEALELGLQEALKLIK